MNNVHVIDFFPTGAVESMYSDNFQLSFLGEQSIQRATEIAFDPKVQAWAIALPHVLHGYLVVDGGEEFSTYEGARQVEVAWFNACRIAGVAPDSPEGLVILSDTRESLGL